MAFNQEFMDSSKRLAALLGHTKLVDSKNADMSNGTSSKENGSPISNSNKGSESSHMNNKSSATLLHFVTKK